MKKILRVFLPFVLVILYVFATVAPASAATIMDYQVVWLNPKSVSGITKSEKSLNFISVVNNAKINFSVSFPSSGGVRICNDKTGYFNPEDSLAISYDETADGKIKITSADGMVAALEYGSDSWKITAFDSLKDETFSITSSEIYFGYQYGKIQKVKIQNSISSNEVIYGFGGRMNGVNQVGKTFTFWNMDGGNFEEDDAYINVPILNSTKGYTLFFNSTNAGTADIGKTDSKIYTLDFVGDIFDMFVYTGSNSENMSAYTSLTGKPVSVPKWALQYWAGATKSHWISEGTDRTLIMVEDVLKGYKDMGIELSALYAEGLTTDPNLYDLADKYGTRILAWNYPDDSEKEQEGIAIDKLPTIKNALNSFIESVIWCIDYSNPTSAITMKNRYTPLWNYGQNGLKGAMVDYGEYVPVNALTYNGKTGIEMHNLWAYYYCKVMDEVWNEGVADRDYILFARAGCAGCQAYTANFTGDQVSTWDGLADQLQCILSLSASGFNLVGGDIGGFNGNPTTELYMRWVQLGTFSPLMRAHGNSARDPWNFGNRAKACFNDHYWLRENILDLLYSATIKANKTGVAMVQSMPAAFPNNATVSKNETQYMFCDNLLVCPVVDDAIVLADVVLPKGKWYDLWSGNEYIGSDSTVKVDANTNRLPVFIKSGAVFPVELSDDFKLTDEITDYKANKTLLVTPPEKDEESIIYNDDSSESVYKNTPLENGGFKISAENNGGTKYLLVYGKNVDSIKVDGKELSKILSKDIKKKDGFYIDGANRTVVSLPSENWKEIEITGKTFTDIAKDCLVYTNSGTELPELTDGKITTDTIVTTKMGSLTVDLGENKSVSQIALKWGAGYAENYVIQGSADGETWTELYSVKGSDGGTEYISIEPTSVRYINIGSIKKATGPQMRMHSIEVYGEGSDNPSVGTNMITVIVILAGALLLVTILAVILILIIKKKKSKKE